jgi:hypothetical protein
MDKWNSESPISHVASKRYINSTIVNARNPKNINNILGLPLLLYATSDMTVRKTATMRLAICNIIW